MRDVVASSLEEAVEVALRKAAPSGATVHVFSSPENDCAEGEVVCSDPLRPVIFHGAPRRRCGPGCRLCARFSVRVRPRVIFHPEVAILVGGGWACMRCGLEGGTGGRQPSRPLVLS